MKKGSMNLCVPIILVLLVCMIALVGMQYVRKVEKFNNTECDITENGSTCTVPGNVCADGKCVDRQDLIRRQVGKEAFVG